MTKPTEIEAPADVAAQGDTVTPPTLPGEAWRGDIDGPVCVTVAAHDTPVAWWWDGRDDEWSRAEICAPSILIAWALSLRADAQRAAEEMRERCADAVANMTDGFTARDYAFALRALPTPARPSPKPPSPPPANDADPWPDFLRARTLTIQQMRRRGMRDATIAAALSMDAEQVAREVGGEAPLCVPGCVRREAEGVGHPGACREKP